MRLRTLPLSTAGIVLGIMLAIVFLGESLTIPGAVGVVLILVGTMLMIEKKDVEEMDDRGSSWLLFAIGSAVFAAMTLAPLPKDFFP